MIATGQMTQVPGDEVSFPLWRLLFRFWTAKTAFGQMHETEAALNAAVAMLPDKIR